MCLRTARNGGNRRSGADIRVINLIGIHNVLGNIIAVGKLIVCRPIQFNTRAITLSITAYGHCTRRVIVITYRDRGNRAFITSLVTLGKVKNILTLIQR